MGKTLPKWHYGQQSFDMLETYLAGKSRRPLGPSGWCGTDVSRDGQDNIVMDVGRYPTVTWYRDSSDIQLHPITFRLQATRIGQFVSSSHRVGVVLQSYGRAYWRYPEAPRTDPRVWKCRVCHGLSPAWQDTESPEHMMMLLMGYHMYTGYGGSCYGDNTTYKLTCSGRHFQKMCYNCDNTGKRDHGNKPIYPLIGNGILLDSNLVPKNPVQLELEGSK